MTSSRQPRICIIVLAAGSSSRFGTTKQLAEFEGVPLVRRAVATANATVGNRVALVVGHDWQAVSKACEPLKGFLLVNDEHARGMGTSLGLAARSLCHAADALLVTLADQPLVTAAHLGEIIASWSGSPHEIVATRFNDTLGVPALFGAACFADLARLDGDTGARQVIRNGGFDVREVEFAGAALDIDTPEDLDRA